MLATAAVAMMAASCSGNKAKCDDAQCAATEQKSEEVVYAGLLPAADAAGVQYILKLDYSDAKDSVKGDYDLYEVYLVADSEGALKDGVDVTTDGDFSGFEKDGKKYLKLEGTTPVYFLVDSDSTITLVNSELEPAATDLNYTLNVVK